MAARKRKKKSPTRGRGRGMERLLVVLEAVSEAGARGAEFGTRAIQKATGFSWDATHYWMKALEAHGLVEGYLDTSRRRTGDYRWKARFRLKRRPGRTRREKEIA